MTDTTQPLADRRIAERRRQRRGDGTDAWFGATGSDEPRLEPEVGTEPASLPDDVAGPMTAMLDAQSTAGRRGLSAFERTFRTFIGGRAVLGLVLMLALAVGGLFSSVRPSLIATIVSIAYGVLAMGTWLLLLPRRKPVLPQVLSQPVSPWWLLTIGADLLAFSTLYVLTPGTGLNFVALLVLPVLMAGVLTPRLLALATAALVALVLLGEAWLHVLDGTNVTQSMTQAGLASAGLLVVVVLAGELAGRLARVELSARDNMEMARQQAALNRLVIEDMQDGVLVIDRRGRVRAANPAARELLVADGMEPVSPTQLRGVEAWSELVATVERAFAGVARLDPSTSSDVTLHFRSGQSRAVRVRVRFTRHQGAKSAEELCVLFLEDVRHLEARSRQERLAAMGRVSAGIAHEIRNPLAAIAQANALLAEDAVDAAAQRLTKMVSDNVERLKHIVDDVLEAAPSRLQGSSVIDVTAQVGAVCADWARSAGLTLGEASPLHLQLPDTPMGVVFDVDHLRRVLINLLDNALRHGSGKPGAVRLRLESREEDRAFLGVVSDGAAIPREVERHLFEPFFSTRSRGTGLGLYICRELCERHGASIGYRSRFHGEQHRNEFFVMMRRQALPVENPPPALQPATSEGIPAP